MLIEAQKRLIGLKRYAIPSLWQPKSKRPFSSMEKQFRRRAGGTMSASFFEVQMSALGGGLNRSTQHFIFEGKDGVWRWIRDFVEGLPRQRKRSCGIAGSTGSRSKRSDGRLVSRHRRFIAKYHHTVEFARLPGVARDWRWRSRNARRYPGA